MTSPIPPVRGAGAARAHARAARAARVRAHVVAVGAPARPGAVPRRGRGAAAHRERAAQRRRARRATERLPRVVAHVPRAAARLPGSRRRRRAASPTRSCDGSSRAAARSVCNAPVTRVVVARPARGRGAPRRRRRRSTRRAACSPTSARPRSTANSSGEEHLPPRRSCATLDRFQYDHGTFKIDWALSGPIPWRAEAGDARRHRARLRQHGPRHRVRRRPRPGPHPRRTRSCSSGQMNKADPTRSPAGTETVWAYTHVPATACDARRRAAASLTGKWDATRASRRSPTAWRPRSRRRHPGSASLITGRHLLSPPGARGAQRQPRRRRARRRHHGVLAAARVPAGARPRSGRDAGPRPVPRRRRRRTRVAVCTARAAPTRPAPRSAADRTRPRASAERDSAAELAQVAQHRGARAVEGARGRTRSPARTSSTTPLVAVDTPSRSRRRRRTPTTTRRRRADPVVERRRSVVASTASVSARCGVGEVVAQRGARLGLPPIGARQRGDALAEPVEPEAVGQAVSGPPATASTSTPRVHREVGDGERAERGVANAATRGASVGRDACRPRSCVRLARDRGGVGPTTSSGSRATTAATGSEAVDRRPERRASPWRRTNHRAPARRAGARRGTSGSAPRPARRGRARRSPTTSSADANTSRAARCARASTGSERRSRRRGATGS